MPIHSMIEGFLSLEGRVHRANAAGSRRNDALWSLLQACLLSHSPKLRAPQTNQPPEQRDKQGQVEMHVDAHKSAQL